MKFSYLLTTLQKIKFDLIFYLRKRKKYLFYPINCLKDLLEKGLGNSAAFAADKSTSDSMYELRSFAANRVTIQLGNAVIREEIIATIQSIYNIYKS